MTIKTITLAWLCLLLATPLCAQQDSPYVPEGYHLDWNDEFDSGSELNSIEWTHEVKNSGWVNHELQNYVNHKTPQGAFVTEVKDGHLVIRCLKENGKIYSGRVYAHVNQGWTYGYIEARIKLPKGRGTWPAFWMMPVHFTSWPADGEIDIMEEVGYHPNYVSSSLHANAHVHSNGTQVTHEMYCAGAEDDYHIYSIEWTGQKITTYVDGRKQLEYANRGLGRDDWPYDDPFYVILNLAWGGDWGGAQGVDESALPAEMLVDYVRVYQNGAVNPEPSDNLKIGDVSFTKAASRIYTATADFVQGRDYVITGDDRPSSPSWYSDPDFFKRNADGSLKFIAVSGKYEVTANFYSNFFKIIPLDSNGEWLTYNKDTGKGAIWMMGNDKVGKPSITFAGNWGASKGWNPTPDMFFPVPQVSDKVYQLTLTVGEQLAPTDVNFKFFHQAGYGNDDSDEFNLKSTSPCHISTTSDVFRIDTSESGNIKLKEGVSLAEGTTYVFTIDCTDPHNAVLNVEEATTSIRDITYMPHSDDFIYDLSGRRVNNPARGIYIRNGHKFLVR